MSEAAPFASSSPSSSKQPLADLHWHEGVGVLTRTLGFAGKDLQDIFVVTVLLITGFASFAQGVFGGFGSQDMFASFSEGFKTLSLLGFGKAMTYNDM